MVSLIQAIVLGLVQGLTEFLPISSTAHLRIVPALLGWPDPGAAFSAVIQLGTLGAVLIYFARDITDLTGAALAGLARRRPLEDHRARLAWFIVLGTVPIGVCGLAFKKLIENEFRSLYVMAGSLILLALVLWAAERIGTFRKGMDAVDWRESQAVGLAQALALVPGSSRSGVTITAGLFVGLARDAAARFSFLLGIPAILAAGLFEFRALLKHGLGGGSFLTLGVATAVSAVSGYLAIAFLLRYLRTHTTYVFIAYRLALGALLLLLLASGHLTPF
jgi:undecaprenyl-diphosphatase